MIKVGKRYKIQKNVWLKLEILNFANYNFLKFGYAALLK